MDLNKELSGFPAPMPESFAENFSKERARLEAEIAQKLQDHINDMSFQVDKNHVILHRFNIASVRAQSRNDERFIMIQDRLKPDLFENESTLFKSIDESLKENYLECYAPIKEDLDEAQKRELNSKMQEFVLELLEKTFSERRQNLEKEREA